jgi:tetratricopeptide (TPR) repeat protein
MVIRKPAFRSNQHLLAAALDLLGEALLRQGRHAEAEPHLRECLAIRLELNPGRSYVFHVQSLLGWALLGQKQFAEAEPLLAKAYEELNQREALQPSPARARVVHQTVERLVQLYEAWGKPAQAGAWRKKLSNVSTDPARTAP